MTLHTVKGVSYLTYNRLSRLDFLHHAFSTRLGGVSKGDCAEMNLAFGRGDSKETVLENYRIFCEAAGFSTDSLVASAQDHHTFVRRVTKADRGTGIYKPRDMQSVDGLITDEKGVTLVTYYADCTPLFFADVKNHAVGLAHAGWRGTVGKIGREVIKQLSMNFGTNPEDLVCCIGPAISKCCYEVDRPVADKFYNAFGNCSDIVFEKGGGKFTVDLLQANRQVLLDCGVNDENITVSDICTKCSSELLWSHRATGGKRGTMAAFMCLK